MQNLDSQIWKSQISISTKLKLYNTCILSIFLYCSECWAATKRDDVHKIDALNQWCLRIRCRADLNGFPLGELDETSGTPPYYVDEDYPAGPEINEPLPERSNWRGSESSTLEIDVYIWCYALIVVAHARNEWMNEWMNTKSRDILKFTKLVPETDTKNWLQKSESDIWVICYANLLAVSSSSRLWHWLEQCSIQRHKSADKTYMSQT